MSSHTSPAAVLLFEAELVAVDTVGLGNKSAASSVALRDQKARFEAHRAAFFKGLFPRSLMICKQSCLKSQADK